MVTQILMEAKIFDLLQKNQITRMPNIPKANYDDLPETVEISSDEDEEEDEEPDEGPTTPSARGSRKEQTSGETETGEGDDKAEEEDEDMGGQPSEAKKRRTEVRIIRDQFDEMIKKLQASDAKVCFICGGAHGIDECVQQDDDQTKNALSHMRTILEEQSKSPSSSEKSRAGTATRGRKSRRRELCLRESDGTEQGSLIRKK